LQLVVEHEPALRVGRASLAAAADVEVASVVRAAEVARGDDDWLAAHVAGDVVAGTALAFGAAGERFSH